MIPAPRGSAAKAHSASSGNHRASARPMVARVMITTVIVANVVVFDQSVHVVNGPFRQRISSCPSATAKALPQGTGGGLMLCRALSVRRRSAGPGLRPTPHLWQRNVPMRV